MIVVVAAACSAVGGFLLALSLVGYGVRGGLAQIIRLQTYRRGGCRCALCVPKDVA